MDPLKHGDGDCTCTVPHGSSMVLPSPNSWILRIVNLEGFQWQLYFALGDSNWMILDVIGLKRWTETNPRNRLMIHCLNWYKVMDMSVANCVFQMLFLMETNAGWWLKTFCAFSVMKWYPFLQLWLNPNCQLVENYNTWHENRRY